MTCGCRHLTRRHFLGAAGAVAVLPIVGCGEGGVPFNVVGEDQVQALGQQSWQQIRQTTQQSDNRSLWTVTQRVSDQLLRAAGENPAAWEVVVFEGGQVNAFALPGKKIGVYEGMFRVADTPDQLAAVISHEVGHVLADHPRERLNTSVVQDLGLNVIEAALGVGDVAYSQEIAALLGMGAQVGLSLPFSRGQEYEADRLGIEIMRNAGYNPQAAVELWREMEAQGGGRFVFMSTHPAPGERASRLQELIAAG